MADPTAVLGLLWTVATGLYDRIGSHRIGKSDLTFQLSWYRTYTTRDTRAILDQAIRHDVCHRKAERLLELHKGVAKWLDGLGFRLIQPDGIKCPHAWTEQKAKSFHDMVELIDKKTEDLETELRHALAARVGSSSPLPSRQGSAR